MGPGAARRDGRRPRPQRALNTPDVVVAGGGPAGWSAARACARRGLDVTLVEPRPDRTWRHTYGAWAHALAGSGTALPPAVVAASATGWAIAVRAHHLEDDYAILDTPALQAALHDDGVRLVRGRAVGMRDGAGVPTLCLDDGRELTGRVVADATGAAQALSRPPATTAARQPRRRPAEQTAVGVILDRATADRVTDGRLLFMDWRPRHGMSGWATFLYAVPLDGDRVLLEETSLARRPGLPLPELRERLRRRLLAAGLDAGDLPFDDPTRIEHVRFAVDTPAHRSPAGVVPLGAAAPLIHPATGYSLTRSLRAATRLADAIADSVTRPEHEVKGDGSGGAVVDAARRAVRGPAAHAVHAMRRRGLDVLLRMPATDVPEFFDRFFALPIAHQRAYQGADDDVAASLGAMSAVFAGLPTRLRAHLILGALGGPGRDQAAAS